MILNINAHLEELFKNSNRIVITASTPFNTKKKKAIEALADIRATYDIELAKSFLQVDLSSCQGSLMSPVDIYINFLRDKSLIDNVGVVLGSLLRSNEWEGDYGLMHHKDFHKWLNDHGIPYYQHDT